MTTTAIQNTLGATNLIMTQLELVRSLIQEYVPGIGQNIIRGIKTLNDDFPFPTVMIQPRMTSPKMITTAKFQTWYTFDIYWWAGNENVEAVTRQVTDMGEIFQKLFSNNALNDVNGANTGQFKIYPPNWVDSDMSEIRYGPALKVPTKPGRPTYGALGYLQLKTQTVTIK